MIISWRATNFKAIEEVDLEFKAINVILGSNSIGKSSLLHSILASAQMSEDRAQGKDSQSMIGYAIDLGGPVEVIHRNKRDEKGSMPWPLVELTGTYLSERSSKRITNTEKLSLKDIRSVDFTLEERSSLQELTPELSMKISSYEGGKREISLVSSLGESLAIATLEGRGRRFVPRLQVAQWADAVYEIAFQHWIGSTPGPDPSSPLLRQKANSRFETVAADFFSLFFRNRNHPASSGDLAFFEKFYEKFRNSYSDRSPVSRKNEWPDFVLSRQEMESLFRALPTTKDFIGAYDTVSSVSSWLEKLIYTGESTPLHELVLYLGPLRVVSISEQINRRSPSSLTPVGRQGEHLPHLLLSRGRELGEYPLPDGTKQKISLLDATNLWLRFFSTSGPLRSEPVKGFTTRIRLGRYGLDQLGTGVSQILPVIVVSLLGTQGTGKLVLIEQPELHLHPDLQRLLSDFFVALSQTPVKFLIETHSEYLVTRLRLLTAKNFVAPDKVSLIFAERSSRNKSESSVKYSQVSIDGLGRADYWPEGFFVNALSDRFELSAIQMSAEG